MEYNIKFKIVSKILYVSKIQKTVDEKKLNNTNVITADDLVFSFSYIRKNYDIVLNFLNLIVLKYGVKSCVVKTMDMDLIYLDLIKNFSTIEKINFIDDQLITPEIFEKLLVFKNLKKIECYECPAYLIEVLDKKNIKILTRHTIKKSNLFLTDNHLNSYTDFYYKKELIINVEMDNQVINDIDFFLSINNKLKQIRVIKYSNETLLTILEYLKKNDEKNIKIYINEKNNDTNEIFQVINYIKKQYKKYISTNNIQFKLEYSKEYRFLNFLKEINIKLVCTILFIVLSIIGVYAGISTYNQYMDEQNINDQLDDISELINLNSEPTIEDNEADINFLSEDDFNSTTIRKEKYWATYYADYSRVIKDLVKINSETIGWIKVNNTKIDYPVVQSNDNSYYLYHDYKKWHNTMGWIFMDYRNDPTNLDKNTIIYGHNVRSGIMFGTLKNTLSPSWYKNENNHIISFNTANQTTTWKVFSIYRTSPTNDYLTNEFNSNEEYNEFINMIKSRSVYNFNVNVTTDDKILTLSSCIGTSDRVVLHAVQIKE